ncbi:winged helix-turn-helix domain-containing protein [Kribbella sp. CA-247076]|uniref:winged helix-turn-helix domain-containing protein n=1 Tax=Kribbella sp. CA-247076 TaxID=3239941 RepID=UPI003D92B2ED
MIRIHFSAADLGRVTFPPDPEPLMEVALAARALRDRAFGERVAETVPMPPVARRWRREAAPRVRPSMRPLFKLIAPAGLFPDFLTPAVPVPGLEPAVEVLMDTPAAVVREELGPWLPADVEPFMHGLLAGHTGSRRALGNAVREVHQEVLTPSSAELDRRYAADLALRSRALLHGGLDALLTSLHPDVEWSNPGGADGPQLPAPVPRLQLPASVPGCAVLTARGPAVRSAVEVHLNGRGLELYPSALTSECLVLDVPGRRPTLVYPCADLPADDLADVDGLADLLGRTRATVLRALTHSATTTQLARRTGISLPSTSDHTRILRNAGLITTHRTQGTALHSLTPTAHHLLTGAGRGNLGQIAKTALRDAESR